MRFPIQSLVIFGLALVLPLAMCTRAVEETAADEKTLADPPPDLQTNPHVSNALVVAERVEGAPDSSGVESGSIVQGVKDGMRPVIGCVRAAREAGELTAGRYTLTLDWDILPDGTIAAPQMTGPAQLLHTSLPPCFAKGMREWRFPATNKGGPVRNFPFGPFEVK